MRSREFVIHLIKSYLVINKFFYDVACLNATIIYKIYNNETKTFTHLSKKFFIKSIADKLINQKTDNQRIFFFQEHQHFFNEQITIRTIRASLNAFEKKAIL